MKVLLVFVLALPLPALATEVGSFDLHLESALASQIVEGEPPRMGLRLATPPPMPRFARRVALDFVDGLRLPLHMTRRKWKLLGLSALGVGAVSLLDEQIQDLLGAGPGSAGSDFALTIRPLGRSEGLALLGATWLWSQQSGKAGIERVTGDALEAVLLAGLASNTLKSVSGRPRPVHGLGSESWGVGAASFPSGEVTQAFAIASVFARHSQRRWIDAVAWSYAGLITWERMNLDAHWASDSLAGAIIGTAVGRWVVRRNGRYAGERPLIVPIVGESEWGLVGNFRVGR